MTINYSKQVLLKRGNTAVSSAYTGPVGEITLDTDLLQLRVHDGTTQGGWVIPSGQDFIDIQNDLSIIANVDTSLLANVSTLLANANSQQTQIDSLLTSVADFVTVGNVEPNTANETFWFNDDDGRLYIKQANVWTDASPTVLPSPEYIFGVLENTAGNIVPDTSNVYSLGSSVAQWKDLWVSNATIYLNSVPLGVDATGNLTYDGNPLVSYVDGNLSVGGEVVSGGGGNYGNVDVANYLPEYGGNILTSRIANGFDGTISQVVLPANTGTLSIINNAGGIDIISNADLPQNWSFGTDGNLTLPGGGQIGSSYGDAGSATLQAGPGGYAIINSNDRQQYVQADNTAVYIGVGWPDNNLNWTFAKDGTISLPLQPGMASNQIKYGMGNLVAYNDGGWTLGEYNGDNFGMTGIRINPGIEGYADLYMPSDTGATTDSVTLSNYFQFGNVALRASNREWKFGFDGGITFPSGAGFAPGDPNQLKTNDSSTQSLDFRDSSGRGYFTNNDGFTLRSNGTYNWLFNTAGKLTAPGDIQINGTTNSINTTTGALVVAGGAGIASDVHIGGTLQITDTTPSTSYDTGALVVNGGVGVNGNINLTGNINILSGNINIQEFTGSTGNFYGDITTGFNAFYAGKSGFTPLPFTVAQFSTNSNSYSQINMENISTGKLASVDFVGTGDIGDDANWFFDIGIANSGYDPVLASENNALGTVIGPLDAYYYVQGNVSVPNTGGNLAIGTSQAGKVVKLFAGGVNAANVVATAAETGLTINRGSLTFSDGSSMSSAYGNVQVVDRLNNGININNGPINFTASPPAYSSPGIQWNDGFQSSIYGNTQVATYLPTSPVILAINSNVAAANAAIITANTAMKGYVDAQIAGVGGGGGSTYSDSNVAAYLVANPQPGTYSNTNVAAYLTGNVTVGNVRSTNGYFWANGAAYAGTYGNTQVAQYLAGTIQTGNVNVGSALRINGTTNTIDTAGGSSINIGSRVNFTGSAAGFGMNVSWPAQFAGNVTFQGTGGISIPNRPAFRISGGTPAFWTTANTNLKGSAITVDYNQGGYFSSSTGVFTAPIYGLYQVTLNARVGSNNGTNQILVLKNGLTTSGNAVMMWESDTNTGTAVHYGVSTVVRLNAGDFLTANITAGNVQFDQNDSWTVTYIG